MKRPTTPDASAPEAAVYLTPAQLAAVVQVSTKTLTRLAQRDPSFPVLYVGGVVRYPRERVLMWFRHREQGRPQSQKQMLSAAQVTVSSAITPSGSGSCAAPCAETGVR